MLYSCHDALFDHDHEFGHLRRISYFFEWRKAYQQAFFRNNAMIKSFSLPRVCTYTVQCMHPLKKTHQPGKLLIMYSIFVKTIYCYLKPCVRGFELYQLQLRLVTYAHLYFFPMIVIYILLKY